MLIAIYGMVMFAGIVYVVGSGLKGVQVKNHKLIGSIVIVMALIHAVAGWVQSDGTELPPLMMGSLMVALLLLNQVSGTGIVKMPVRIHRGIGIAILVMAVLHAGVGMLEALEKIPQH